MATCRSNSKVDRFPRDNYSFTRKGGRFLSRDRHSCSPYPQSQGKFFRDPSKGSARINRSTCTPPARLNSERDINNYLDMIHYDDGKQDLSAILDDEEVVADKRDRKFHWGEDVAKQYDLKQVHMLDMLYYMYKRYNTVNFYSLGLLEPGMIIYYLEPFTLGRHEDGHGPGIAQVRGARMKMKGRFGIVVKMHATCLQVAQVYTFHNRGLGSKPPKVWNEYVDLRSAEEKDLHTFSKHGPMVVAESSCDIRLDSVAHLVTSKVSLSNQILCAGKITAESLERLRAMVREMEAC